MEDSAHTWASLAGRSEAETALFEADVLMAADDDQAPFASDLRHLATAHARRQTAATVPRSLATTT
jgi:hypothetical protein